MNNKRNIILLLFAIALSLNVSAQKSIVQKVYAYGFSASFKDSVVYFTDIQEIDSAWVNVKTKFLDGRENYSYQLKEYFSNQGDRQRVCMIVFALKKKDIEKKYLKMKKKYIKEGKFDIRYLSKDEFLFTPVSPNEFFDDETVTSVKDKKKKKSKKESKRKAAAQQQVAPTENTPNE